MRVLVSLNPGEITQVLVRRVLYQDSKTNARESSHQEMPLQNREHQKIYKQISMENAIEIREVKRKG